MDAKTLSAHRAHMRIIMAGSVAPQACLPADNDDEEILAELPCDCEDDYED